MLPYRTHAMTLTDDELIVMDIVSFEEVPPAMLRKEVFEATWALGYCHSLDDLSLRKTVDKLERLQFVAIDRTGEDVLVVATARGGAAWATERCPVWDRFAYVKSDEVTSGREQINVCSPGRGTPDAHLDLMGLEGFQLEGRTTVQVEADWGILPWTRFPSIFQVDAFVVSDDGLALSFHEYECHREYWIDVRQLQKFLKSK